MLCKLVLGSTYLVLVMILRVVSVLIYGKIVVVIISLWHKLKLKDFTDDKSWSWDLKSYFPLG